MSKRELQRIVGECAGSVSMCWNPAPTGIFDATLASTYVDAAVTEIITKLNINIENLDE